MSVEMKKNILSILLSLLFIASSAWGAWVKVDDRDASVAYSGSWNQTSPSTAYMNTATFTVSTSATATYSFTGIQVRFYVWQYDTGQDLNVYIDDGFQQTVNISDGSEASIQAWESGILPDTAHTLRLEVVSGEPHVDAFEHSVSGPPDEDGPTPDPMENLAAIPAETIRSGSRAQAIPITAWTAIPPIPIGLRQGTQAVMRRIGQRQYRQLPVPLAGRHPKWSGIDHTMEAGRKAIPITS
jgi:hypothetical protein